MEVVSQTNHFFLICISIATNGFLPYMVEIEVLSGEGGLTVHR